MARKPEGRAAPASTASAPGGGLSRNRLAVGWQALGSAATLAAALWVAWRFGLAAQGGFGLAKSWFDAGAVIAAAGLPQGFLHLMYRRQVPAASLRRWALRAGVVPALAAVAAAAGLWSIGQPLAAAVLLSLPFAVAHLLARSVLLAQQGGAVFGAVTALPSLLVLGGVAVIVMSGSAQGFVPVLLLAAVLSGLVSAGLAWRTVDEDGDGNGALPGGELWRVSLQTGLQAALGALLAVGLLSTVAHAGQGAAAVGAASLGLHLYQLFAVAAGYLAPLLFDRLARQDRPAWRFAPPALRRAGIAVLAGSAVGLAGCALMPAWSPWLLPLALMLPAGAAAVGARLSATVLLARGAYVELSVQALWRLLLAMALTALALRWLPAAAAVAVALGVVEAATWWRAHRLTRADVS